MQERLNEIALDSLPKTFRDAVLITRALNLRYLWIDSLCIIQDDIHDWEIEAANMYSIYANAHITLAASTAGDSNGGCFNTLTPTIHIPYADQIWHFRASGAALFGNSDSNPLSKRGWTLQEISLSRRVLNFRMEQMVWECIEFAETEDALVPPSSGYQLSNFPKRLTQSSDHYYHWNLLMGDYTSRSFTYAKDRLAALAGLLANFTNVTGDVPVLGLWQGNLHRDLLWHVEGFAKTSCVPNIPTWSWLALLGKFEPVNTVSHRGEQRTKALKVLQIEISWSGHALTSGLTAAFLRVQGRVKLFRILRDARGSFFSVGWENSFALFSEGDEQIVCGWCTIDILQGSLEPLVWCLEIGTVGKSRNFKEELEEQYEVLVLYKISKEENVFRRIGAGRIEKSNWTWSPLPWVEGFTETGHPGLSFDDAPIEELRII